MKHGVRLVQLSEENVPIVAKVMGVEEESVRVVLSEDHKHNRIRFFQIEYVNNVPTRAWFCRPE